MDTLSWTRSSVPTTTGSPPFPTPYLTGQENRTDERQTRADETKTQKEKDILRKRPPPKHWLSPDSSLPLATLRRVICNILCVCAFGHAGLEQVWAAIKLDEDGDESLWTDGVGRMCDRLNNMSVVAGLLLGTSAAFLTTTPTRISIANWTLRGPYLCFLGAFGLFIGGIVVASAAVLVISKSRPTWSDQVLFSSRFNIYSTLIVLSYPFVSIGVATILLAFGILAAVWSAEDVGIQSAAALLLVLPISAGVLFSVSCATAIAKKHVVAQNQNHGNLGKEGV